MKRIRVANTTKGVAGHKHRCRREDEAPGRLGRYQEALSG